MVLITIVIGVYKPSYNCGAPPCIDSICVVLASMISMCKFRFLGKKVVIHREKGVILESLQFCLHVWDTFIYNLVCVLVIGFVHVSNCHRWSYPISDPRHVSPRWQSPTEALAGPLRCHLPEKQLGCIDIEHQSIILHPWPWPWWDTFAVLLIPWWYRDPRSLEASLKWSIYYRGLARYKPWLYIYIYIWRNKNDFTATSLEWWSVRVINYPNLTLPSYFRSVSCSDLSR